MNNVEVDAPVFGQARLVGALFAWDHLSHSSVGDPCWVNTSDDDLLPD